MVALTAERAAGTARRRAAGRRAQASAADLAGGRRRGAARHGVTGVPGVEAIIAVASGKGGVGKSTTAVNLALGLRDLGLRVGLLDADIYGPSMPRLTGIREKPQLNDERKMIPIDRFGLAIMSIGFLVEEETADDLARADGDVGASPRCCVTSRGARSTSWWSICRPAPAMRSSRMAQQVPLQGRGHRVDAAGPRR